MRHSINHRSAFTLIELLVVIAIIAILAIVVVLTLNPAQLLAQGRDSNRVSDMSTLNSAINLYNTDQSGSPSFSLGNASSVYISLPDPTISGNTTSTCSSLGLPTLPSGYSYQCASPQSYRNGNGSGWIPINFQNISSGNPLGSLPVDPTNSSSSGLYYSYYTNGSQYEVTSIFESQKYKTQYATTLLDPYYPEVNAKGSSLSISPLFNPSGLVGYWPLNEGSGSSTIDQSGNGNNGTWSGTPGGVNNTYYSSGKVGNWAGSFDGSTNYVQANLSLITGSFTLSAWVDPSSNGAYSIMTPTNNTIKFFVDQPGYGYGLSIDNAYAETTGYYLPLNTWTFVTASYNGTTASTYVNGALSGASTSTFNATSTGPIYLGDGGLGASNPSYQADHGLIDDVRIYNRALSAAEVQALYNAEK